MAFNLIFIFSSIRDKILKLEQISITVKSCAAFGNSSFFSNYFPTHSPFPSKINFFQYRNILAQNPHSEIFILILQLLLVGLQ
jgi:hypothetical protein